MYQATDNATLGPQLRLFRGDQRSPPSRGHHLGLSAEMTLREFFREYALPCVLAARRAAPRNVQSYEESLRLWVLYTADPALGSIDNAVCASFSLLLAERRGKQGRPVSPNTVRKHLGAIQFLLDLAGPKLIGLTGPGRRTNESKASGRGLFGLDKDGRPRGTPYLEKPPKRHKPSEDVFTVEEISKWLAGCQYAKAPRKIPGLPPEKFWTALVFWNYNVGTRIGTTVAITYDMLDGDVLRVPAEYLKGHNDQDFYVNAEARKVVEAIRTSDPRIFPWPHGMTYLHKVRRDLLAAAGLPKPRRFGFHGGRKCLCTELMQINSLAAQKAMGHLGIAMSRDAYTSRRIVAEAMKHLPQPVLPTRQMRLF